MFKNYLIIALRNIKRHKGYSFINIAGLAMGMACCILILLWVQDELSYDSFHKNASQLYRVHQEITENNVDYFSWNSPPPLAQTLKEENPEIENITRFLPFSQRLLQYGEKRHYEERFCFTDQSFLDMFDFALVKGDPSKALSNPNSIIITEELAEKYFGKQNPLGKVIRVDNRFDLIVSGVAKDIAGKTQLKFDCLVSLMLYEKFDENIRFDDWSYNTFLSTYVLLHKDVQLHEFNQKNSLSTY